MPEQKTPWPESGYGRSLTIDSAAASQDVSDALDWAMGATQIIRDFWPINEVPSQLVAELKLVGGLASQFREHALKLVAHANELAKAPKTEGR